MKKKFFVWTLALTLMAPSITVFAGVPSSSRSQVTNNSVITVLTVDKATEMAIANSTAIKNALDSEDLSDENLKKAKDSLYEATTGAGIVNAHASLLSLELSRSLNLEDIKVQKENVEFQIVQYFNMIINAEKDLEIDDQQLELDKKDLDILELKVKLGLASQLEYDTELLAYEKALNTRETTLSSIDKAYRTLNSYIGQPLEKKYTLELNLPYKEVGEVNLTPYVSNFIKESTSIKQLENAVTVARFRVDNFEISYNPATGEVLEAGTSYDEYVAALNKATRSLDDAKSALETGIVNTYNELKDTEISIKAAELDVQNLKNQLTVLEKRLELGQVTQLDVDKMAYNIVKAEHEIEKAKKAYTIAVTGFQNPSLLSGLSTGTGSGAQ